MSTISICYAANRQIGVDCLKLLLEADISPTALLLPENGSHNTQLQDLLPEIPVSIGRKIAPEKVAGSDYLISVHFPHIIPQEIIDLPKIGTLNLHPAYLPWNRGWHTPTWAIMDGTPYGATLHWIDEGVDTGPIALQQKIEVQDTDTANELYQRALAVEIAVFAEAIPMIKEGVLPQIPQEGEGTSHTKKDIQSIRELSHTMSTEELDRRTRALTTNNPDEAAYFA
jgi:methionyl-tRNA formyltransferase